jgi:hypothetical protein
LLIVKYDGGGQRLEIELATVGWERCWGAVT